jgi:hypothetical protein
MNDSDGCLLDFDKVCDELCASKIILADKKVSELLQVIAGSRRLYELAVECTDAFDFDFEFRKAQRMSDGKKGLILPTGRRKLIAFVFCLLYCIDIKEISLDELAHDYYPDATINREFENFCRAVIHPFRRAVGEEFLDDSEPPVPQRESLNPPAPRLLPEFGTRPGQSGGELAVRSGGYEGESRDLTVVRRSVDYTVEDVGDDEIDSATREILLNCARGIIDTVTREAALLPYERDELLTVCEAFQKAVCIGGADSVRLIYIALKNTLRASALNDPLSPLIAQLTEVIARI